jgi:hypothetical protein
MFPNQSEDTKHSQQVADSSENRVQYGSRQCLIHPPRLLGSIGGGSIPFQVFRIILTLDTHSSVPQHRKPHTECQKAAENECKCYEENACPGVLTCAVRCPVLRVKRSFC